MRTQTERVCIFAKYIHVYGYMFIYLCSRVLGGLTPPSPNAQRPELGDAVDGCARTRYAVGESPNNAVTRYSTKGNAVTRYAVYRITCGTPSASICLMES